MFGSYKLEPWRNIMGGDRTVYRFVTDKKARRLGFVECGDGEWHDEKNGIFYPKATTGMMLTDLMDALSSEFWWFRWLPTVLSGIAAFLMILNLFI